MKDILTKLLLLSLFIVFSINGIGQDIHIKTRSENIQIHNDTSFTNSVNVVLHKSNEVLLFPIFYDTELEEVSDITVYEKKGNRYKQIKNPTFKEESVDIDYITSKKVKSIIIPPEVEAKITFNINCRELMYFSDLRLFSYDDIDTLKYQITVPEAFLFSYDIINKDSLNFLKIDSLKSESLMKWDIEIVPLKVLPNPLAYFGIYRNMKVPLMRTIVVPKECKTKEKEYLSQWYLNRAQARRGLDSTAIKKIDEITVGISYPLEIVDVLYEYVKTNFKYVGIEIGIGAFVPTHVNEVFLYKQGDCKDLSNFLSEALNYKGIKSQVALASTYHHICDCNFPSLGSANHVICIAYIDNKPILLDPTDPIHMPNTPVQSLQDRSILIINQDGGEYYKVNGFSPKQNVITYNVDLKMDVDKLLMKGRYKVCYEGISGNFLKRTLMDVDSDEQISIAKKHYESIFGNQSISDCNIYNNKQELNADGVLSVKGKIFDDGNNRFVFLDFVPRLIESENRETMLEGTHLGSSVGKMVNIDITLDKPFEAFKPIEHHLLNDGVSLKLIISSHSEYIINFSYEYVNDYLYVEKENSEAINEILKSFKKLTNEPIILKNKI